MKKLFIASIAVFLILILFIFVDSISFFVGGLLIQTGINIQDFSSYGHSQRGVEVSPKELYQAVLNSNREASGLTSVSPRRPRHPDVLIIMCIDPRLDDNKVLGDSRDFYDVIRVPGSVITEEVIESVKLSVFKHNVKLVIVATHSDCAMEKLAKTEEGIRDYPVLAKGVKEERLGISHLVENKLLTEKINSNELLIVHQRIDTATGRFLE